MMYQIKILSVGKTKEEWLNTAIEEYQKRLTHVVNFQFHWCKNDEQLAALAKKETAIVALDPVGKSTSSEQFSKFLMAQFEQRGLHLTFLIGSADGLPSSIRENYPLISLSPLTFTHQLTRLILVEQIYRAFEIAKGSKYHK